MHASEQIASDYALWGEYVDPDNTMTEQEFDAMPLNARLELMAECFPDETRDDEED